MAMDRSVGERILAKARECNKRACFSLLPSSSRISSRRTRIENHGAQLFFEFSNRQAQGRLRDAAAIGGTPEMALLRHGDDVSQFRRCHGEVVRLLIAILNRLDVKWQFDLQNPVT